MHIFEQLIDYGMDPSISSQAADWAWNNRWQFANASTPDQQVAFTRMIGDISKY